MQIEVAARPLDDIESAAGEHNTVVAGIDRAQKVRGRRLERAGERAWLSDLLAQRGAGLAAFAAGVGEGELAHRAAQRRDDAGRVLIRQTAEDGDDAAAMEALAQLLGQERGALRVVGDVENPSDAVAAHDLEAARIAHRRRSFGHRPFMQRAAGKRSRLQRRGGVDRMEPRA